MSSGEEEKERQEQKFELSAGLVMHDWSMLVAHRLADLPATSHLVYRGEISEDAVTGTAGLNTGLQYLQP